MGAADPALPLNFFSANYYSALEVMVAAIALLILLSSLDDIFIDIWYWSRRVYRSFTVEKRYPRMTADHLREKSEQPIAIMAPAWMEHDVIAAMIENMVEVLNYQNYVIFIGTYVNDAKTIHEVELMRVRYKHLHRVEVPHFGPTCKADCLNFIVEAIFAYEQEKGMAFAGVVLHDSEDVLHPLELKYFNFLLPRKDMIQLPVASMERRWYELVAGTYMDEFAESHAKDMVVRESVTGVVPSAGVGTCFSRKAMLALVGLTHNKPFNVESLTEDYDVGNRLGHLGMAAIFGVFPVQLRIERKSWFAKAGKRELIINMPMCVREFFPDTFRQAYRQKSRWVLGIGLQSWEQIKWPDSLAARYLLLHDRKSTVTAFVNLLAYLLVVQYLVIQIGVWTGLWELFYPTLFSEGSFWRWVIYLNAASLVIRSTQRFYFTAILYGWAHGLMSIPRMVIGNFVNFMAVARAWRLYLSYLFRGRKLVWDKTMHDFPSGSQLLRKRQRLGELLQAWQAVDESMLSAALLEQTTTHMPLGRIMVSNGWLDEETLAEAIAYQADLPRARLSAALILKNQHGGFNDLGTHYRAIYIGVDNGNRPLLALASPLSSAELAELEAVFGAMPRQRIVRESEISIALRLLAGQDDSFETPNYGSAGVPLLGDMLVEQGLLHRGEFNAAMQTYRPNLHGRVGDYLVERRIILREVIEKVVNQQRLMHAQLLHEKV